MIQPTDPEISTAIAEFERGCVDVDDMVTSQPWADDLPVHIGSGAAAGMA